jgi:predicted ATPase
VLIFDDLQWADAASLDLLQYLVRQWPGRRLFIQGAYREGEAAQNPAFGRAVAELNRPRVLSVTTVGRLTAGETAALAAAHVGAPLDPATAPLLFAYSEGNPFFAEELLRGWLKSGALVRGAGDQPAEVFRLGAQGEPALPSTILGAVCRQLERLPPEVVDLLRTAAIIWRTLDLALLAEVMGQDAERVEEHLRAAVQARLVGALADGAFAFSHDKIRECLYEEVTTVRRQRVHGFIGRALETRSDERLDPGLAWGNEVGPLGPRASRFC